MTTPFAALSVMTKSASLSIPQRPAALHPFAVIDPFVKEAGFFGDVRDGIWNNTMKPLGNAAGQVSQGLGQMASGISEAVGNGYKTPGRYIGGAMQGGMNEFTQPGNVNLGAIGQGMLDGGWNAGKQSMGRSMAGNQKALQGAGNLAGGVAKTAWGANPYVMAGRASMGAGQGAMTGAQNMVNDFTHMVNDFKQNIMAGMPQGGGGGGGRPFDPTGMIPPGQPGTTLQGPPAPASSPQYPAWSGSMVPQQGGGYMNGFGGGNGMAAIGAPPSFSAPSQPAPTMGSAPRTNVTQMPGQGGGPSNADLSRIMGSYDPVSPYDQRKATRIREMWQQNGGRVSPNQVYADPGYDQIDKSGSLTPFAVSDLRKEASAPAKLAGGIAGWLLGALQGGAKILNRGSRMAKATAGRAAKAEVGAAEKARASATSAGAPGDLPALPSKRQAFDDAYAGAGNTRQSLANVMGNAGLRIDSSPGLQKVINYGAPAAAAGGLFYGGNRMGHSSGLEQGHSEGFDTGADYGIQSTLANMPKDPGFFGRIADVLTGQQAGPQAYDIQSMLDANKSKILQQLRAA